MQYIYVELYIGISFALTHTYILSKLQSGDEKNNFVLCVWQMTAPRQLTTPQGYLHLYFVTTQHYFIYTYIHKLYAKNQLKHYNTSMFFLCLFILFFFFERKIKQFS